MLFSFFVAMFGMRRVVPATLDPGELPMSFGNRFALMCVGLLVSVVSALPQSAEAGRIGRLPEDLSKGYVVAESNFGNGTVSGPVRLTRLGPQVRLPGGTWEYCRRSCSETLRVETVDFWEGRANGEQGLSQECGLLCLQFRGRY
ncbi:hypothetical protein SAMN04488061_2269 [Filomicrobium insigne]|uniref:Uncharacterized protein n=1 Tax=Filomicrobium insigne TaxID=418854 RepID=A0A1H0Q662_9HYPH|nr:hypothetical protein [Filomicrobium insigne]SDP12881.1 hypothetical protein SAMN04488061_2269 [Filomicrobium insigne]